MPIYKIAQLATQLLSLLYNKLLTSENLMSALEHFITCLAESETEDDKLNMHETRYTINEHMCLRISSGPLQKIQQCHSV